MLVSATRWMVLLLAINSAVAQFDQVRQIAVSLEASFKAISQTVIGDERTLFGISKTFSGGCCTDNTASAGHPKRIDLVIALDESGSVGSRNFAIVKRFVQEIASRFVVSSSATRISIVTWSTRVTLEFDFDKYINSDGVRSGIGRIRYSGGWTATGDALNFIRTKLFTKSPRDAKKVLFVITDGKSNRQKYQPATEAKLLKNAGVEIFVFGIGSSVRDSELVAIASLPTKSHKFRVKQFNDLSSLSHLIGNTKCKKSTVYDACGRKCRCYRGKLTYCRRVRKSFLDMTDLERCRYIRAVRTASTVQPYKSEYDRLIGSHEQLFFVGIHNGDFFLPWHRWYILAYENLLRKVDCRVTVPYWEWSLDSANPFGSDVWNTDTCKFTGLGGSGNPSCVTTGPFAYPGWKLTPSAQNACLRRNFNRLTPDCTAVQDVIDVDVQDFDDFHIALEVVLHNTVHVRISGTMASVESANAPEFFLHHGFVDKIWGDWQERGISFKRKEYYSNTTAMPGTTFSPRDVHDINRQPYYVRAEYQEPKQPCTIGGRKFTISQIAALSLTARLKLDSTPVPPIPKAALTNFGVPQSIIKRIPAVTKRVFGVEIKVD